MGFPNTFNARFSDSIAPPTVYPRTNEKPESVLSAFGPGIFCSADTVSASTGGEGASKFASHPLESSGQTGSGIFTRLSSRAAGNGLSASFSDRKRIHELARRRIRNGHWRTGKSRDSDENDVQVSTPGR